LALALVKFGNPVVLNSLIQEPADLAGWIYQPWPLGYGQALWLLIGVVSVLVGRKGRLGLPRWLTVAAMAWLGWQAAATWASIDPGLSSRVLIHYGSVVGSFLLGAFVLSGRIGGSSTFGPASVHGHDASRDLGASASAVAGVDRWFWLALIAGFAWVLWMGFDQHYGGLEATRSLVREQGGWETLPEDYLRRLESNRVFSTLFYANTLAGVVLLLLPALIVASWELWPERMRLFRAVSTGLLAYAGVACLVWSGSKAGWLIGVVMAGLIGLELVRNTRLKIWVIILALVIGVVGFGVRFEDYLRKGATSAVARLEYWRIAGLVILDNPIAGTGPGTFAKEHQKRKRQGAEMTRLVHNDYLQQGSDSGLVGFGLFVAWLGGGMVRAYRYRNCSRLHFAIWIGLVGWVIQEFFEFGMFIPGIAWPAMVLLGCLAGQQHSSRQPSDTLLASTHQ
jgi:hypothetical protein